jgi:hypothetical protein
MLLVMVSNAAAAAAIFCARNFIPKTCTKVLKNAFYYYFHTMKAVGSLVVLTLYIMCMVFALLL